VAAVEIKREIKSQKVK